MLLSSSDNEVEMLLAFCNGEQKGFSFLYNKYVEAIYLFIIRFVIDKQTAEDITAEVFIKLWNRHSQIKDSSKVGSYLYAIARNTCNDHFNKIKKTKELSKGFIQFTSEADENNHMHNIIRAEFMREIYTALDKLPVQCGKVFRMLYIQGKNYEEVAEELNISVATVKSHKVKGLQWLRKKLSYFLALLFF